MGYYRTCAWALMILVCTNCGGGSGPATGPTLPPDVRTEILASDNQGLQGTLRFPAPELTPVSDGGQEWTRVELPGSDALSGPAGEPGVPRCRWLFAIPQGATPTLTSMEVKRGAQLPLRLYPYQPMATEASVEVDDYPDSEPPAALYAGAPFTVDTTAYARPGPYPRVPCRVTLLGSVRDLRLGVFECACGEYDPVTETFTCFEEVDFTVGFVGGSGAFLSAESQGPFERLAEPYTTAVVNRATLGAYVAPSAGVARACLGAELLILTPPEFLTQASALAQWKASTGTSAEVVVVNDGTGPGPDSNDEIDALIDERYETCLIRPSYILLFGDSEQIPTFHLQRYLKDPGVMVATDYPYATYATPPGAMDLCPDFGVGRIAVQTDVQAQTVVDKIIAYESTPPLSPAFYGTVSIAAYFECCRTGGNPPGLEDGRSFILTAERTRADLNTVGRSVQRIYNTDTDHHTDYVGDPTPVAHANGTLLPAALRASSGYTWPGTTQDVIDAFNAGRFLFIHLDHGATWGWGDPRFTTSHLASLTNAGALPVVFSENCSSGHFDEGADCFAEQILRMQGGGAIGVFAWTRMSNTRFFHSLVQGALGAIWPAAFPQYNAGGQQRRRLGDILNYSRLYMLGAVLSADPTSDSYLNIINHTRLYHLFGDPSLSIREKSPLRMPTTFFEELQPAWINIYYAMEGAVITAFQQSPLGGPRTPLGRGQVEAGVARVDQVAPREAGWSLTYVAQHADGTAVELGP